MPLIDLDQVTKIYGKQENKVKAIKDINFSLDEGEFKAIMGPSGSGKSTLLNILGLLDKPTEGKYYFNQKNINELSHKEKARLRGEDIGFIIQYFALIYDYTVYQNVKVPLDYTKIKRRKIKSKIISMLEKVGIADKIDKYPNQISGGERQRVAVARALINHPTLILADEPTGALDRDTEKEVLDLFKMINQDGHTIIIVTHDQKVANECDDIIKLEDGKLYV